MRAAQVLIIGASLLALAGCSGNLRDLDVTRGAPEEFAIVPSKPLEVPATINALPEPTPGGANRTDLTPLGDAVAALGGNPAALAEGGVPASDQALVASASRFGRSPGIRATLAEEDAAFRARKRIFNWRLVKDNEYNRAYSGQRLDADLWLDRVRQPGSNIRTPSAPPSAQ